jgi:Methyltransferase FkbM domain
MAAATRLKRLLPAGERVVRIPAGLASGCRVSSNLRTDSLRVILGLYEIELNPFIRELCHPGRAVFDIGGQIGLEALMFAKLSGSQILSVDSDEHCCETIESNSELNGALGRLISVRQAYVGYGEGEVTLDDLAAETFEPGFIKMDIEGVEARALRGAAGLLSGSRPALIVEVHGQDVEDECIDVLRSHCYHISTVDQRRWLRDRRPIEHNRWLIARP